MNYQRILITLLIVCVLWYLFFNRYEFLTVKSRRPLRVARLTGRKRHVVLGPRGRTRFVGTTPPRSTSQVNCVQINCPKDFDDDVVCWKCQETI